MKTETETETPVLVKIGSINDEAKILSHLRWVNTSKDHLKIVSEILLEHLWKVTEGGDPHDEMKNIIKDVHRDINDMYELASIVQYLKKDS